MMNTIFQKQAIFFSIWCISCAQDPILQRMESEKDGNQHTDTIQQGAMQTEDTQKKETKPSATVAKTETVLPKIGPPTQEAQLPKIAPPKEQSLEAVAPPPPNPKDGKFVTFTGTMVVEKWSGKPIRVDVFDGDQRKIGGERPSVIISETVKQIGEFELFLPEKDTQVWIGAYIDEDEDGRPGPTDPSGWYEGNPVSSKENQKNIHITLDVPNAPPPK